MFWVLLLAVSCLFVKLFWIFISPILIALLLTSIFYPVYQLLVSWMPWKTIAAALVLCLIVLLFSFPILFFLTEVPEKTFELFSEIDKLTIHFGINTVQLINQFLENFHQKLSLMIFNIAIVLCLAFVFFISGEKLKDYVSSLIPLPEAEKMHLITGFNEVCRAVFLSTWVIAFIEGVLGGIGFFFSGLGSGFLGGLMIGCSVFLPPLGSWIVILPATFILFNQGNPGTAFLYFIYNSVHIVACELILMPKLIGQKRHINLTLILLSILAGLKMFGFFGLFYGPVLISMFLMIAESYKKHRDYCFPKKNMV